MIKKEYIEIIEQLKYEQSRNGKNKIWSNEFNCDIDIDNPENLSSILNAIINFEKKHAYIEGGLSAQSNIKNALGIGLVNSLYNHYNKQ